MRAHLYLEGGGDRREANTRCREAFSKLIRSAGFGERMPGLTACGSRNNALEHFEIAHATAKAGDYHAMLIDSESPVADPEKPWTHLKKQDAWGAPAGAVDEQVLLMTTCMETWISADRQALRDRYGREFKESALFDSAGIESRLPGELYEALRKATKDCNSRYEKGKPSFEMLEKLSPANLSGLPSFVRFVRVLNDRLPAPARRAGR